MSEVAPLVQSALSHRRQTKFTPANLRQIENLVERGKSKAEIAEIIGVTPATLQVTCSKLGVSLRRPKSDDWKGALGGGRSSSQERKAPHHQRPSGDVPPSHENQMNTQSFEVAPMATDETIIPLLPKLRQQQASAACATLTLRSRGKERAIDLPIDQEVLGRFALEAEFRSMNLGEMIARVLSSISQDDSFDSVLSPSVKKAT